MHQLGVATGLDLREKLLHAFVVEQRGAVVLEVALDEHGLNVAALVVEDGCEQVPECELGPEGFSEVENR